MEATRRPPGSILARAQGGVDADTTMRRLPRPVVLAAALLAPAAGFTAACGDSDHDEAPQRATKSAAPAAGAAAPAATAARPTLARDLQAGRRRGFPRRDRAGQ